MKSWLPARQFGPFVIIVFAIVAVYFLFRGHNDPGGGFIAALTVTIAFLISSLVHQRHVETHRKVVNIFILLLTIGVFCMLGASFAPLLLGDAYFQAVWTPLSIPTLGKVGTVFVFDLGVFLVVLASLTMAIMEVLEYLEPKS